ncbi:MAG: DEAD/DEAH box helicase family protein [Bacilli bacterium]|nr:DEAD/DEAH box helicase family protein [Bacilli bacterium]
MSTKYICPICGNEDPRFIGLVKGKPYCRRCISFRGEGVEEDLTPPKNVLLDLSYKLSKEQQSLSDRTLQNFKNGIDTLIYAVCGSGKTEISYGVIGYAMSKGMKVGFALPRRDVVTELFHRLAAAFPDNKIVAVYGGHNEDLTGDCIILTTHQLYRYEKYFDLLVMDEIDAFPFKGSDVLVSLFKRSLRGHCVMMSATPSEAVRKEFSKPGKAILELHTRFHKKPIPVPTPIHRFGAFKVTFVIKKLLDYRKKGLKALIFVPTIDMAESLCSTLSTFVPDGDFVSSKKSDRRETIEWFRKRKNGYLVTTAVLERGVTFKNIQVIIFEADHPVYDSAALVQIAGRAGRKFDAPTGDVYFVMEKDTEHTKKAINEIKHCNTYL